MSVYEIQIRPNGSWVKVTHYIFRSWGGRRKLDGKPYYGPSALLGQGLPNPYTEPGGSND